MRRPLVLAFEGLGWWAACLGIWLTSLSSVPGQELVLGALVAVPCACMAVVGRRAAQVGWRARPAWFKPLALLPVAIVTDTVRALSTAVPGRRQPGHFARVELAGGRGDGSLPSGRRALATWLISATPASIVTAIDVETGQVLVHVLVEGQPNMQREVGK